MPGTDAEIMTQISRTFGGGRYKRLVRLKDWKYGRTAVLVAREPQIVKTEDALAEAGLPLHAIYDHPLVRWLERGLVFRQPGGFPVQQAYRLKLMVLLRKHLRLTNNELIALMGTYNSSGDAHTTGTLFDPVTAETAVRDLIRRTDQEIRMLLRLRWTLLGMLPAADARPDVDLQAPPEWRSVAFMVGAARDREAVRAARRERDRRIMANRAKDVGG